MIISTVDIVNAKDITIDPNTSGGLKKAVERAENGDTIYMKNGVYTCENNRGIVINKSLTIQGKGKNVVIDAQGKDRILTLAYWIKENENISFPKYSVTLKNLTMINGRKGNGGAICVDMGYEFIGGDSFIYLKQNKLSVIGCTFINNSASSGGAIDSATEVINSTFKNNSAGYLGGALYCSNINFTIRGSTFTNNKAELGGGAIEDSCENNFTLNNCIFTNNEAKYGGAISGGNSYATIRNSIFTNNKAEEYGGAIYGANNIINCIFNSNTAAKECGGAISGGDNVSSCTFFNNTAEYGGAISGFNILNSCTFKNNQAKYGGAAYSYGNINKCIFTNNQAEYGGAVYYLLGTISSCTFKNNRAIFKGGAIFSQIHKLEKDKTIIINSKFEYNEAGKVYNAISKNSSNHKNVSLKNVTITPKEGTPLKPDLIISKISKEGNTHVIFIKNIGKGNSGKSVLGVYDSKKLIKKANVKAIEKGKTVFVIVTLAKKFKNKIKTFKVNYNSKIKEANTKNNIRKAK